MLQSGMTLKMKDLRTKMETEIIRLVHNNKNVELQRTQIKKLLNHEIIQMMRTHKINKVDPDRNCSPE
jgi:hypothetical protein